MAQLIDNTYFFGEISLPESVIDGDFATIDDYIERYEKQALIDLLGYTLYKDLKAEIDAEAGYSTRWDRLVNGHEYEVSYNGDTHLVKWEGLVNDEKRSLLAYYIYFYFVRYNITHTTGFGEMMQQSENAQRISPSQKMVNAWNEYIRLRGLVGEPEIDPTAYNFLDNFEDDSTNGYDKWLFKVEGRMNTFGI